MSINSVAAESCPCRMSARTHRHEAPRAAPCLDVQQRVVQDAGDFGVPSMRARSGIANASGVNERRASRPGSESVLDSVNMLIRYFVRYRRSRRMRRGHGILSQSTQKPARPTGAPAVADRACEARLRPCLHLPPGSRDTASCLARSPRTGRVHAARRDPIRRPALAATAVSLGFTLSGTPYRQTSRRRHSGRPHPPSAIERLASGSPTIMETTMSASRMSHAPGANSPPTRAALEVAAASLDLSS